MSANINSPGQIVDEIIAAGENSGDYLKLAKKGGGHQGKIWESALHSTCKCILTIAVNETFIAAV